MSESRAEDVAVGTRFYGYLPMADEVVLGPVRSTRDGFVDAAAHRAGLADVYNRYLRCSTDPLYRIEHEALIALLRPLFVTSFLIDDFLADKSFFGAGSVLISSASSKTAYGLAFCLSSRRGAPGAPKVIGLTSSRHADFVRSLGCYDSTVVYGDVSVIDTGGDAVYVDMSGDAALRATVHDHWNERLAYSCSVGGTHWQALGGSKGLAGPRPVLFFAPAQAEKRLADWGASGLQDRLAVAWLAFIARVADPSRPWLRVVAGTGREAVAASYEALIEGRVPANEGRILAL